MAIFTQGAAIPDLLTGLDLDFAELEGGEAVVEAVFGGIWCRTPAAVLPAPFLALLPKG